VEFRLIVFRPFRGEIIEGKIISSSKEGIRVSLEFFDDILIPGPMSLFPGSKFNNSEQLWVWFTEDGNELFFDNYGIVRFRVESEEWQDALPDAPRKLSESGYAPQVAPTPWTIYVSIVAEGLKLGGCSEGEGILIVLGFQGSMQQAGLGLTDWW
jgi:DNA-directed RNA polymerase III subunit RPC8